MRREISGRSPGGACGKRTSGEADGNRLRPDAIRMPADLRAPASDRLSRFAGSQRRANPRKACWMAASRSTPREWSLAPGRRKSRSASCPQRTARETWARKSMVFSKAARGQKSRSRGPALAEVACVTGNVLYVGSPLPQHLERGPKRRKPRYVKPAMRVAKPAPILRS